MVRIRLLSITCISQFKIALRAFTNQSAFIGLSNEYAPRVISPSPTSSSSSNISLASDNSDIRILDEAIDLRVNTVMPTVLPLPMSQAGKKNIR